jgi:hypothetical protein
MGMLCAVLAALCIGLAVPLGAVTVCAWAMGGRQRPAPTTPGLRDFLDALGRRR